ncbi:kinase-like protein [Leucogyrophana mollusca]|uniref:Kinase-like protein n=1 Tax=Leucogyrophana mollusca TaxID=85980 RepID=A0ACB8B6T3_9AGAM|nr:kinase-like protein [Leucogyrophana mollusca]
MNAQNAIYAIKRVSLDKTDAETMKGYMNEIGLLKRLAGNKRIIQLFDSEVRPGGGGSKGYLMLVMECGEVDLAKLLGEQQKEPLDMVWVGYYWQQMLQAVHVIHEEKIVHSDLKPANFVLVRGQLKLIDFGIANAIANDTTNIQRDHQIGTVNYMSPEAIELPDGMRRLKVGRPSDVWSLGCILYQMVYGHPPFQHLSVYQKMKAIPDVGHEIAFPGWNVIRTMRMCLERNPKERAVIPELLEQAWLAGEPPTPAPPPAPHPAPKTARELLGPEETIINPYYMKQLLEYGIKLGQQAAAQGGEIEVGHLEREAEVGFFVFFFEGVFWGFFG